MPYHTFFSFSTGLSRPVRVPKGTKARIAEHVAEVERTFRFETTQYRDNPPHWKTTEIPADVDDEAACDLVRRHNGFVRRLYSDMAKGRQKGQPCETITPENAKKFWHALVELDLPPSRWTEDYYRERMEHLYEVMRGRESEGVTLGAPPLTPEQAGAVVVLFSEWLDPGDLRLTVCKGRDELSGTDEYFWCSRCGAVDRDDARDEALGCERRAKGECDLANVYGDILEIDDEDEEGDGDT